MSALTTLLLFCSAIIYAETDTDEPVQPRIIGGVRAPENGLPFVAAILRFDGRPHCTGSIIHEGWILTASHCLTDFIKKPWLLHVRVAEPVINGPGGLTYSVQNLYPHPKTGNLGSKVRNDIGLIELKSSLEWSSSVRRIRLGSVNDEDEVPVLVAGYGDEHPNDRGSGRRLNYILLKTVKPDICESWIFRDRRTEICAFEGINKTSCFGDSGGPMIDLRTCEQVGVLSEILFKTESAPCTGDLPVVYTRISPFLPWIEEVTGVDFTN